MKSTKLIVAVILSVLSLNAFAWGDREQGALAGLIIGGLIVNQAHANHRHNHHYTPPPPVYYAPPRVVYYAPPPPVVQYRQRQRFQMFNGECPTVNGYQTFPSYVTDGYGNTSLVCEL